MLKFEIESKTVAEFNKLNNQGALVLRPEYQRKVVWSESAKVALMETILLGFPIPEVYLAYETTADGDETASVVDGQQRLSSLLDFLNGKYPLKNLDSSSLAEFNEKYFQDLPDGVRREFFQYRFPIRRLSNMEEGFIREVFTRVNKVNVVLTDQELRNAMLPGPFYDFLKDCANHSITVSSDIFSHNRRNRGGDLEFFAEVFGSCIFGLSNKKTELDERYDRFSANFEKYEEDSRDFLALLDFLTENIRWGGRPRWSNIVDLFTLIYVCWEFRLDLLGGSPNPSFYGQVFDDFQDSISKRKRGENVWSDNDARAMVFSVLGFSEEDAISLFDKYISGVRNSSDLSARRNRSNALREFLSKALEFNKKSN
ncbi:DUF262 domain-containing protein [Jonesia quinghaiensis]|uniref:DUF262 domain-containing protein n=1 Tax=Jonesia quinghaiensis TaxID=262806 RepID=UPI0004281050|nr:DUF262 domain-containing protein [Jonesia quinghaiensis]